MPFSPETVIPTEGKPGAGDEGHYDPAIDAATAPLRRALVRLRVADADIASKTVRVGDVGFVRELLVVHVYVTIAPDNPDQDAPAAPPWRTLPWHPVALMEEAVSHGWAAFSQGEALRRNIEWLDPVRSDELKRKLVPLVEAFERDAYQPASLRSLVTADEVRKLWAAPGVDVVAVDRTCRAQSRRTGVSLCGDR